MSVNNHNPVEKLKKLIKGKWSTIDAGASKIGLTRAQLYYEFTKKPLDPNFIQTVAKAMNVSYDLLAAKINYKSDSADLSMDYDENAIGNEGKDVNNDISQLSNKRNGINVVTPNSPLHVNSIPFLPMPVDKHLQNIKNDPKLARTYRQEIASDAQSEFAANAPDDRMSPEIPFGTLLELVNKDPRKEPDWGFAYYIVTGGKEYVAWVHRCERAAHYKLEFSHPSYPSREVAIKDIEGFYLVWYARKRVMPRFKPR